MLIRPDDQEAATTLDFLVGYMPEREGKEIPQNLGICHLSEISRSTAV